MSIKEIFSHLNVRSFGNYCSSFLRYVCCTPRIQIHRQDRIDSQTPNQSDDSKDESDRKDAWTATVCILSADTETPNPHDDHRSNSESTDQVADGIRVSTSNDQDNDVGKQLRHYIFQRDLHKDTVHGNVKDGYVSQQLLQYIRQKDMNKKKRGGDVKDSDVGQQLLQYVRQKDVNKKTTGGEDRDCRVDEELRKYIRRRDMNQKTIYGNDEDCDVGQQKRQYIYQREKNKKTAYNKCETPLKFDGDKDRSDRIDQVTARICVLSAENDDIETNHGENTDSSSILRKDLSADSGKSNQPDNNKSQSESTYQVVDRIRDLASKSEIPTLFNDNTEKSKRKNKVGARISVLAAGCETTEILEDTKDELYIIDRVTAGIHILSADSETPNPPDDIKSESESTCQVDDGIRIPSSNVEDVYVNQQLLQYVRQKDMNKKTTCSKRQQQDVEDADVDSPLHQYTRQRDMNEKTIRGENEISKTSDGNKAHANLNRCWRELAYWQQQMEKWTALVNKQKSKKSYQNCSLQQKSTMPAAASAASAQRQQHAAIHYLVSSSSSSSPSVLSSLIEPVASVSGSVSPDLTIAKLARVPRGLVSSGTCLVAEYSDNSDSNDEGSEQQNFIRKDRPLAEVNVESVRQSPCSDGNNALKTATVCSTDANLIDWVQLICTICRRKFTSEDILKKHIASSQLHKDNMESRLSSKQLQAVTAQSIMAGSGRNQQGRYRDRAKERRQMHCAGDDDAKRRRIASPPSPN